MSIGPVVVGPAVASASAPLLVDVHHIPRAAGWGGSGVGVVVVGLAVSHTPPMSTGGAVVPAS